MFPSLLYSCETWGNLNKLKKRLFLMEKKALRSCLGIKQSTPDAILYVEINKPDIVTTIYSWQQKFYEKFKSIDIELSTAKVFGKGLGI